MSMRIKKQKRYLVTFDETVHYLATEVMAFSEEEARQKFNIALEKGDIPIVDSDGYAKVEVIK